jgi:hypothetical protein
MRFGDIQAGSAPAFMDGRAPRMDVWSKNSSQALPVPYEGMVYRSPRQAATVSSAGTRGAAVVSL